MIKGGGKTQCPAVLDLLCKARQPALLEAAAEQNLGQVMHCDDAP